MSLTLNSEAYRKLIREDLDWLLKQPRTLERDHIQHILEWQMEYAEAVVAHERTLIAYEQAKKGKA